MDQQALHREELLEAEIRRLRQLVRNLSDAVIAGDGDPVGLADAQARAMAHAAKDLIDGV